MRPSVVSASKSGATAPMRRPPSCTARLMISSCYCPGAYSNAMTVERQHLLASSRILGMLLRDRTVLVTGGASGLGGATVDTIVSAGGRAVIVDVNAETGRAKAAQHGAGTRF